MTPKPIELPKPTVAPGSGHDLLTPIGSPSTRLALPRNNHTLDSGAAFGGYSRAVSAAMLGITGIGALVGAPTAARAEEPIKDVDAAQPLVHDVRKEADTLAKAMHKLSAAEIELARKELWSAYIDAGGIETTPISVATLSADDTLHVKTPGELRFEKLANDIEARMRITAWDMAHPESVEFIEGAPGYKKLPEKVVRGMVTDALKDVPLGELPGGSSLAGIVKSLPNAGHIDAAHMSYNQVIDALGDAQKEWFEAKFGPFLEEHKIEAAVVAAGVVTAARYASPEVAGVLDRVTPRIRVWRDATDDGRLRGEASLKYRDRHVLPDLDLSGHARTDAGPVRLRAGVGGTLSVEGDEHATGRLTLGARVGDRENWADLSGHVDHRGRTGARLSLGLDRPEHDLSIRSHLTGRFGEGTAIDRDAAGRVTWTLDAGKDLKLKNADGRVGLFAGYGVDTSGRNEDFRVGVAFTLRW